MEAVTKEKLRGKENEQSCDSEFEMTWNNFDFKLSDFVLVLQVYFYIFILSF